MDPALIRPGRVDFQALISYCSPYQVQQLFFNFYPESSQEDADNFNNQLKCLGLQQQVSPATLQGHFLMYKNSPQRAIEHLDELNGNSISQKAAMLNAQNM